MKIATAFIWGRARNLIGALVILSALGAAGCPHTVRPTGDETANCAKESGRDIFHTLIPRVSTIIATGPDFGAVTVALTKLVADYGVDVVTCVVATVRDRNSKAAAVATGDEKTLHERSETWAEQWIAEHGAEIEETS